MHAQVGQPRFSSDPLPHAHQTNLCQKAQEIGVWKTAKCPLTQWQTDSTLSSLGCSLED